jgi:hypothetical protein
MIIDLYTREGHSGFKYNKALLIAGYLADIIDEWQNSGKPGMVRVKCPLR